MTIRVAINGFGRIGRLALRAIYESGRTDIDVVAINDLGAVDMNAYLLKRDSVHGTFPFDVKVEGNIMDLGRGPIRVTSERDPANLPWAELNVDIVYECTGFFADKEKASAHLTAGAKKVLISAPASGVDKTIVFGVNHDTLTADDIIVSNASCTTNCLAPVAQVLHDAVGIEKGIMTTVHAYTGDQRVLDTLHSDPRRARACGLSMIPTSTGAARAVGLVLPELAGKLDGTSVRVPTPNVSMIDLTFVSKKDTTIEEINAAIKSAAEGRLKGVLAYVTEPTVSIDYNHDPASSSFDASQTSVMDGNLVRILSWYDNEWGFSNRMSDTAKIMAGL
ncbi:type I glyceraldehyde-3-phosphate dehydrogenase [Paremcibacter congregatus]|uniref:Glyceraldehyde-3-phosphate dehydrogenase n=1 Tax=Paremcibacter congregatus TaxID=2043170 RepID=A0A2G4YWA2_9PROT|nr:type I glyceraldehyde-3-phosphate dehydrogenase [Paremcibacter congregatus]PHZ85706.1 type I glyceraldehyde-3-phosphate dehydrogenase [Paremcibacter congregatus]QDE26667.1 type I glyceraldehyde-3-phosphate dehydrogenase [Paremcibacter congregatus]|tara:strand:- start:570 stop:1574 length:1005 start_codon:yes stop_codon:yes gene_type:complete